MITVKKGDIVKITFVSADGSHDWVLDAFDARTPIINSGKSAVVEFVASQSGQFEFYCSVGSHRQLGMVGTLVVQ